MQNFNEIYLKLKQNYLYLGVVLLTAFSSFILIFGIYFLDSNWVRILTNINSVFTAIWIIALLLIDKKVSLAVRFILVVLIIFNLLQIK
jgi:hypothetical protein